MCDEGSRVANVAKWLDVLYRGFCQLSCEQDETAPQGLEPRNPAPEAGVLPITPGRKVRQGEYRPDGDFPHGRRARAGNAHSISRNLFDAADREARNFLGASCERVRHPLRVRSPRQLDSKSGRHLDVTGARGVVVGREPTQLEPRRAVSRQGDDCRRIPPGRWVQARLDTGRWTDLPALEIDRHNFGHSRDLAGMPREVGNCELLVDVPKSDPRAARPIPNEQLGIWTGGKTFAQAPPLSLAFLFLLPRALRGFLWSPLAGRRSLVGGPGVARTATSNKCEYEQAGCQDRAF